MAGCGRMRLVCLVLMLIGTPTTVEAAVDVAALARDVLSPDCETRLSASWAFLQAAKPAALPDLRYALEQRSPAAAAYLHDAFVFLQQEELAQATVQSLVKSAVEASAAAVHDPDDERRRFAGYVAAYLVHHLPEQSSPARMMIIGYLVERMVRSAGEPQAEAFREELEELFRVHALEPQVYVAAGLLRFQQDSPDRLVPILIAGLQAPEFPVRYAAINVLLAAGMPDVCYNPLDSPAQRQEALARLKRWWQRQAERAVEPPTEHEPKEER